MEEEIDSTRESSVMNTQEISSAKAMSSQEVLMEEVTSSQMINAEILDGQINDSQIIASENIPIATEQNSPKSETMSKDKDIITTKITSLDEKNKVNSFSQNLDPSIRLSDENGYTNESQSEVNSLMRVLKTFVLITMKVKVLNLVNL